MKLEQDGLGDKNWHQFSWSPVGGCWEIAFILNEIATFHSFNYKFHPAAWQLEERLSICFTWSSRRRQLCSKCSWSRGIHSGGQRSSHRSLSQRERWELRGGKGTWRLSNWVSVCETRQDLNWDGVFIGKRKIEVLRTGRKRAIGDLELFGKCSSIYFFLLPWEKFIGKSTEFI